MTGNRNGGQRPPRQHKAGDGLSAAASALSRTINNPEVRDILNDFQRLNSDEARGWFADQFLARSADAIDHMWPIFYEMLKAVEDRKLYANPGYTTNRKAYGSFKEYFEARVGRPFDTWAQLERTYHYVSANRPELFGGSLQDALDAQRQAKALRDDITARDGADRAGQRSSGRPKTLDNIQGSAPTGTSKDRALRKLRKDAPELHARVLANELSPHAAMVEAGFRPKTFTVRSDSPDAIAATLRRQLSTEVLARVVDLLNGGDR